MSYCDRKFENCLSEQRGWLSGCILNTYEKLLPTSMWVRRFNELPKLTMYICTTIYHLVFWGLFLYLAVTAYYHGVRDSWLSHDKSSGDCDEVSVALTGRFKADYNGNWESSPRYDDSRAVYAVQFSSYSRSGDELARDIARIDQAVDAVGEKGQYRDLAWNLVAQSALETSVAPEGGGKMTVSFGADFRRVLQRENLITVAVMSAGGVAEGGCEISTAADFPAGVFESSWSAEPAAGECYRIAQLFGASDDRASSRRLSNRDAFSGRKGGRVLQTDAAEFKFRFDMRAAASAVAVNSGILKIEELAEIRNSIYTGYQGDDFTYAPTSAPTTTGPIVTPSPAPSVALSTFAPTVTNHPSGRPSGDPTTYPTATPSLPTASPSLEPSNRPTGEPSSTSSLPTRCPTGVPSGHSSQAPSAPSGTPTTVPTGLPTDQPTPRPSSEPSAIPTDRPSSAATGIPSSQPYVHPTGQPSSVPSQLPSGHPSSSPSTALSGQPSAFSTSDPSPSDRPSSEPSDSPSCEPTANPTGELTMSRRLTEQDTGQSIGSTNIEYTYARRLASAINDPFDLYYNSVGSGTSAVLACTSGICLLKSGTTSKPIYGYPIVKHYAGTNCYDESVWPSSYFRSDPTTNADWASRHDHTFDLLLGVIFFSDASDAHSFALEASAALGEENGDLVVPDRVYPSMKAAIDGDSLNYDHSAVCGLNSSNLPRECFLIVYNTYDNSDFEINYDHYELYAGACRNSVSYDNGLFATEPALPTELTESIFECVRKPYESVFIAIGLSYVSADLASRWVFAVFMFLIVGGLACCNNYNPNLGEYDGGSRVGQPRRQCDAYAHKLATHNRNTSGGVIVPDSLGDPLEDKFSDENPLAASLRSLEARPAPTSVPVIKGFSTDGRARGSSALARRKAQQKGDSYEQEL